MVCARGEQLLRFVDEGQLRFSHSFLGLAEPRYCRAEGLHPILTLFWRRVVRNGGCNEQLRLAVGTACNDEISSDHVAFLCEVMRPQHEETLGVPKQCALVAAERTEDVDSLFGRLLGGIAFQNAVAFMCRGENLRRRLQDLFATPLLMFSLGCGTVRRLDVPLRCRDR